MENDEKGEKNRKYHFIGEMGSQHRITIPPVIRKLLGDLEMGDILDVVVSMYKRKSEV